MTNRRGRASFAIVAFATVLGVLTPRIGHAQTDEELKAARELFQEAYKDEQEKRYEQALEKFRRVAKVKESASVRYRIATVLEALGRLREARDAYRGVAAMKPGLPPNQQEIADSGAEHALQIDRRIPKLVVTADNAPADTRVSVDGAPVPTGKPVEQDPGEHVVSASAAGMKPFEQKVTLPDDGGEVRTNVQLERDQDREQAAAPTPAATGDQHRTLAYIALGAGGVLLATSAVFLVAREGAISDIHDACPDVHACPRSKQSEVDSASSRASTFGPLGIGFGALGLAAAGVGVYLLVRPSPTSGPAGAAPAAASLRVSPRLVSGGGAIAFGGTF